MIIKTLAELAEPDEASLLIRPLGIDPAEVAEGVADYRQRLVAGFELIDGVPEGTRSSYDRVRAIYAYGVFCYDLYTVAGNQARLVLEQALRERFLPFYNGTVTFIDGRGSEYQVEAERFSQLFDLDDPLVKRNWLLKLQSGRDPIRFNGMLTSLLRWAREEGLLGGQRDRRQDKYRVIFRNYAAHPEHHTEMPDDAAAEIFRLAKFINQIWGAPVASQVRREVVALAWTDTAITYGRAESFVVDARLPDATCVIVRADPLDDTLGTSFDTRHEMTSRPFEYLWGPGSWTEGAQWLGSESPEGDEVKVLDRLFLLRYHDRRLYMPFDVRTAAALGAHGRDGFWYLLRADHPFDAYGHQRQVIAGAQTHHAVGFCGECPVETITAGSWQEAIDHCAAAGEDVTPQPVPDIRSTMCRIPRWNQLTQDGQWVSTACEK